MTAFLRAGFALIIALLYLTAARLPAVAAAAFLTGVVVDSGKPVADVVVSATGNNVTQRTKTDVNGRFVFPNMTPGEYVVTALGPSSSGSVSVDLPASGAEVSISLGPRQLGTVTVAAEATVRKSGTDVTLNRTALTRSPAAGTFGELLIQLPGAARGANGVVHINGDHGDINYVVDGVSIPQELNRNIGTEFNPNDVEFVDVLEGAYPAQYGERFASVLNISTRGSSGTPGFTGEAKLGSFGHIDTTVGYQSPLGAGSFVAAVRDDNSKRGLDPPNRNSPHNSASDANQFTRFTLPHGNNFLNVTVSHAYRTFQIPIDIIAGQPASSDDNESQDDLFGAVQERRGLGERGSLAYGVGYKRSHIRDFGDPANDWTFGETLNLAAGGSPTDCANALTIPTFFNGTCGYSLASNRTATDYRFNVDDALASGSHQVAWGALYDITSVAKLYAVTLQPGNFLAPIFTPGTPNAPYTVADRAPNNGDTESAYVQDTWRMSSAFELDYGVREDAFQIRSTEFQRGFSMVSPRVKLTRVLAPRASVYAYYGRFFTPFSFENVSPSAAQILNLPLQKSVAAFDLKPQRDSEYEIGGHMPLGAGDLGVRVMHKDATDLIDDTQVGVTLLHQDINYQFGRIGVQALYYQLPTARQGRSYFTVNHTYSVNKGCETQLLAPCFGSPTDFTPADHEQRWGSAAGILRNDAHGGWISMDAEYGSGLSSAACPAGTPSFCKYSPHTTFDIERGIQVGRRTTLTARIRNLLNDQYRITYLNAQGNHYYTGRALDVGLSFGGR